MRGRAVMLVAAAVLLLLVVTVPGRSAPVVSPIQKVKFAGQFPPIFEYAYRQYAIEAGFFTKEGLDVEFIGSTAGLTAIRALIAGHVEFANEGMTGTVSAIREGGDHRIVAVVNAANAYVVMVRDTIARPRDLPGKRWAITQLGAISHTYPVIYLKKIGVDPAQIRWVPVGGVAARARALIAGQVDATVVTYGEYLRMRDTKDIKMLVSLTNELPPIPISVLSVSKRLIEGKPDFAQAFVNGTLNAVRHAHTIVGRRAYIDLFKKFEPDFTTKQYEEMYQFYFLNSVDLLNANGGLDPFVIRSGMQQMVESGQLDRMLPLHDVIEPRFVNQYLAENGWFDKKTLTTGRYLTQMLRR